MKSKKTKVPAKLTNAEFAKLTFMRWAASTSTKPWLPRRPQALATWELALSLEAQVEE
jgi:hypothetical protein